MSKIIGKIILALYVIALGFYFIYYNNGLDTGLPGYISALQIDLFGSAYDKITIGLAMAIFLIPPLVLVAVIKKPGRAPREPGTKPPPGWAENLVAAGVVGAVVAVGAHFFLGHEIEVNSSAKIYQVDLSDESKKLPDDAKYVSVVGQVQDDYLYVIETVNGSRTESAKLYVPITGRTWTPDQPITYVARLSYGYSTSPAKDGKDLDYSIDETVGNPARPFAAEISKSGVPLAVAHGYEKEANLKLADTLYLLDQTEFPGGKPRDKYRDIEPFLPWLIPAGLPVSGILLLIGVVGLRLRRREADA
jgi:hypothetical protein